MRKQFKHIAVGEEVAAQFDKLKKYSHETDEETLIRLIRDNIYSEGASQKDDEQMQGGKT